MRRRVLILSAVLFLFLCQTTAYAADRSGGDSLWVITEGEETVDLTGYKEEVLRTYRVFQAVSLALGAVSLGFSAFRLLGTEGSEAQRAKKMILWTLLAVAVVNLLPVVITAGAEIGRQYAWSPGT